MKKLFLLALISLLLVQKNHAQFNENPIINLENFDKQRVHWGYFLGFNQYDFKFDANENTGDIQVAKSIGFNVGLIGNLRLSDHFDLRLEPGLYYTQRNLGFPGFSEERDFLREVRSTYIHFPLLLKISTKRLGNFKPYIVGGVSTSINLGSNEDSPDDNSNGTFRTKRSTYYYEIGFGIDFYLFYFKFSPSIRGVFAFSDELVPDADPNSPWTGNLNSIFSRGVFINFTFE
ncbi:outer membrane beta-barrel protein [Leptobacterium flavescens]|uniref:Outer membrane beta-barrel protein n=1 Tax=Leptobacterium flavescens TaxID=472055 RepID=A0A6P0UKJ1_9FLAO|nr:porin family protein [Leptobacterium flavescens]NER12408.1 outer membrane beta-barrel protein [Leptobacterium flavescens]